MRLLPVALSPETLSVTAIEVAQVSDVSMLLEGERKGCMFATVLGGFYCCFFFPRQIGPRERGHSAHSMGESEGDRRLTSRLWGLPSKSWHRAM